MARILVIIEKGESSYGAYAPNVPGCVAVGDTQEEVETLIQEALQTHLALLQEEHLPLLETTVAAKYIDIPISA
ncbi:type II toxin-antitoxin system HicB family antitoxin [Tengunoibacter tsumagoiensis]|uniref:HicB family protein n=1 Tax=Tengunoibacter tsumagoiensis TaxID=2014871 RepID=A0A402A4P5_9CHLR|nr:type II toxin-antitoxin system HicB family antitoxin [Tengunoibacter tsumagoiensis]GCE13971.1 HicB family protein [Tengunoibacter tsumagoiensis]